MLKRRHFLKIGAAGGASFLLPWGGIMPKAWAQALDGRLLDPAKQPIFFHDVPNALDPGFIYQSQNPKRGRYKVGMYPITQDLGLVDNITGLPLAPTPLFAYGDSLPTATYPGKTFEVQKDESIQVKWENKLVDAFGNPVPHLLPVDTTLHWAYSLHGYTAFSIEANGIPVVPHVHGGHTESESDGNPEYFFSPGWMVTGPRWVKKDYVYHNDQEAGTVWYHDHALGITRLNVYAGLAGFFIIRDKQDTGKPNNPLKLPAFPYEAAFAIQDKMFTKSGQLFYPSFFQDPYYDEFYDGPLPPPINDGPTALAEFFGDHILVNGKIWPKMNVEPRPYRIRLLNGCDSRFLEMRLKKVGLTETDPNAGTPVSYFQIGTDDGLLGTPVQINGPLVMGPGERVDLLIDFSDHENSRLIIQNTAPDAPYPDGELFYPERRTDRIMAFDVIVPLDTAVPKSTVGLNTPLRDGGTYTIKEDPVRTRKVALFEGMDEFGRLQPLLGVIDPTLPAQVGQPPITQATDGALGWFQDITENPGLNDVEVWDIYNFTGDAHPIHLHLVAFEVLERHMIDESKVNLIERVQPQHNSDPTIPATYGTAFTAILDGDALLGTQLSVPDNWKGPKDTVQVYPGQMTRIKMKFDRPGRYVWHCHILSHEDHEMMRPYFVGGGNNPALQVSATPVRAENYPNPFTDHTNFRLELEESAQLELRIFDGAGRHVRTLARGSYGSGEHTISWNGTNRLGMAIPSGMYFYQVLVNEEIAATGKVIKQ